MATPVPTVLSLNLLYLHLDIIIDYIIFNIYINNIGVSQLRQTAWMLFGMQNTYITLSLHCLSCYFSPSDSLIVLTIGLVKYCSTVFLPVLISTMPVMPGNISSLASGLALKLGFAIRT